MSTTLLKSDDSNPGAEIITAEGLDEGNQIITTEMSTVTVETAALTQEDAALPETQPLPDWSQIAVLGVVTAVAVWGLVEVSKNFSRGYKAAGGGKMPWWYAGVLRLGSIAVGAGVGTLLYGTLNGQDGWPWGTAIGAGAGALCTLIVAVLKRRIAKKAE
jgi:hypothetical protein